jgi:Flp pilus assembly pilin Flp
MSELILRIKNILERECGQALAEYALILGLIAIACVVTLGLLGLALPDPYSDFIDASGFGGS